MRVARRGERCWPAADAARPVVPERCATWAGAPPAGELFRQKYLRARIAEGTGSEVGRGRVVQLTELNQLP